MSNVAFIDTETLGLDPDVNPVWEVGLILPDGTERQWHVKVTDRDIALAHPKALEISQFHERYGKERQPDEPEWVARDLYDLLPKGTHLAGAVVSFDEERLRRLMWKHGYSPRWHYHLIDVEALAAGYLGGQAAAGQEIRGADNEDEAEVGRSYLSIASPPWDSEELSKALGVEPDKFDRHTALGDARWAKAIYAAAIGPMVGGVGVTDDGD